MSEAKKCAHESCSCTVQSGQKYCSQTCEDSVGVTTLKCDCGHAGCEARSI